MYQTTATEEGAAATDTGDGGGGLYVGGELVKGEVWCGLVVIW